MIGITRKNRIIAGILALVLSLVVGYALFNESLNINGTASATGDFKLEFTKLGVINQVGSHGATADISADKRKLTVTTPGLEYPGSYVEVPVTIKNTGSLSAKLIGITTNGIENNDIKVTYSGVAQDEVMALNEEKIMKIKVMWNKSSITTSSSLQFTIELNYEQYTNGGGILPPSEVLATGSVGPSATYEFQSNGNLLIKGTGAIDDRVCNYLGSGGCETYATETFSRQLYRKILTNEGISSELINVTIELKDLIFANYTDLGMTREEAKKILMAPTSEDDLELPESYAEQVLTVLDNTPKITDIIIADGITSIGDFFFEKTYASETNVTISSSVTSIGQYTFGTVVLGTLNIEGNAFLKQNTFRNSQIKNVNIRGNLSYSGTDVNEPFVHAEINNLTFDEGVTSIGNKLFYYVNPSTITLSSTITEIGKDAFCPNYASTGFTIINKTGKAFDWNLIVGNPTNTLFETGTVNTVNGKTITITK